MCKIPDLKPQRSTRKRDDIIRWWPLKLFGIIAEELIIGSQMISKSIFSLDRRHSEEEMFGQQLAWREHRWCSGEWLFGGGGGRVGVHFRLSARLKWLSQGGYWFNNNTRHRLDCRNIITVAKHVEHDVCLCFSKTCVFTSPLPLHPHTPNEKQNPTAVTLVSPGSPQCPVLSQGVLPSWAYRFSYFSPFFLMSHSRRCGDGFTFGLVNTTCCSWRKKNLNICVCLFSSTPGSLTWRAQGHRV